MSYAVKEIFLTLQGEGAHVGRAAVFCRFAGCNLWSGREQDRAGATCRFCDTDFVGTDGTLGGRYATAAELAETIARQWTGAAANRYVVLTGGEPLLQVDTALIEALHARGFSIGVETNGTIDPPDGMDWICVSPKAGAELRVRHGHELKLVYPQADAAPEAFVDLAFGRFSLQPMDGP
ncbi:MAG: 7-carboxy-7-deazaguanine synthase, partial [Bradyrhizobium sp.]